MAKTTRVKNRTQDKIKELDVLVNKNGLVYDHGANGVAATSPKGLKMYIGSKKAGGDKEMFYAAAGIRNYMTKYNKKPDDIALESIIDRAGKAEATRGEWEEKYLQNRKSREDRIALEGPVKKSKVRVIKKEAVVIDASNTINAINKSTMEATPTKAGRKKESFKTIVNKSIAKGIINVSSAAGRATTDNAASKTIKELGLDMSNQYLTEYDKGDHKYVSIRITTIASGKKLTSTVNSRNFDGDLSKMYQVASDIRAVILRTGKVPTLEAKTKIYENYGAIKKPSKVALSRKKRKSPSFPRPSEMSPPSYIGDTNETTTTPATPEQEPKLKTRGIFTRAKMWLFGE